MIGNFYKFVCFKSTKENASQWIKMLFSTVIGNIPVVHVSVSELMLSLKEMGETH